MSECQVCHGTGIAEYADQYSPVTISRAQHEALMAAVKACEGIDTFAWSACIADCAEARDNAMLRIIACRKALAVLRAAGIPEGE